MGYDFTLAKGEQTATEQGPRTPFPPVPVTSSSEPSVDALLQDQSQLKTELIEVKEALVKEKAQNAKRCQDLLALLSALSAKLSPPPPRKHPLHTISLPCSLSSFCPILFSSYSQPTFALSVCASLTDNGLYYFLVGYTYLLCLACFLVVNYLCVTWMAKIINVPYT